MTRKLIAGCVSAFALGACLPAAAGAEAAHRATESVQEGNANCGHEIPGVPITGVAKFVRKGGTIKVLYKASHLEAGKTYSLELWTPLGPATCEKVAALGTFEANKRGAGGAKGEALNVPFAVTEFFATASDGTQTNDSFIANLP